MQKLGIGILLAAFVVAGGMVMFMDDDGSASRTEQEQQNETQTASVAETGVVHEMVLGEDGYTPRDITITQGDTIEFSTNLDEPFWPASNVHPTHRIFSEFDPKEPVPASETWSFTFNRVGEWGYHDHLAPIHTGTITVTQ